MSSYLYPIRPKVIVDTLKEARRKGGGILPAADIEVLEDLVESHAALLKACKAALKKVSGTNIMGEEVSPELCAQLRAAIDAGSRLP